MAENFDQYKPPRGTKEYADLYDEFITVMEGYVNELIDAREGETDLLTNLANYLNYTLVSNVDGDSTYKCTNMSEGTDDYDYITVKQANSLSSTGITGVNDIGIGTLLANDILVVNAAGSALEGRPCTYTTVSGTFGCAYNGNYNVNVSSSPAETTLPAGINGGCISFSDLGGNVDGSHTITIYSATNEKIFGLEGWSGGADGPLLINNYAHISFTLVYTGSTFGWVLTNLLR